MEGMHHPHRQRKLALRRFLNPSYPHFTQKDDDSTWSRRLQTLQIAPTTPLASSNPGKGKTMRGFAESMGLDEDGVQRFVTMSP